MGAIVNNYETPPWIFGPLNAAMGFTIDAAATPENTKCRRFLTAKKNGLTFDWSGETVFCFPPSYMGRYKPWIEKAIYEFVTNRVESALIVPFNAETEIFADVWQIAHYVIAPKKRMRFWIPKELYDQVGGGAYLYACTIMFTQKNFDRQTLVRLSKIGTVIDLYKGVFQQ